jgi:hypothetical protein
MARSMVVAWAYPKNIAHIELETAFTCGVNKLSLSRKLCSICIYKAICLQINFFSLPEHVFFTKDLATVFNVKVCIIVQNTSRYEVFVTARYLKTFFETDGAVDAYYNSLDM